MAAFAATLAFFGVGGGVGAAARAGADFFCRFFTGVGGGEGVAGILGAFLGSVGKSMIYEGGFTRREGSRYLFIFGSSGAFIFTFTFVAPISDAILLLLLFSISVIFILTLPFRRLGGVYTASTSFDSNFRQRLAAVLFLLRPVFLGSRDGGSGLFYILIFAIAREDGTRIPLWPRGFLFRFLACPAHGLCSGGGFWRRIRGAGASSGGRLFLALGAALGLWFGVGVLFPGSFSGQRHQCGLKSLGYVERVGNL